MAGTKSLGKRKHASSPQRRLLHQFSARAAARSRRQIIRGTDRLEHSDEEEEWKEEGEEADEDDEEDEGEVVVAPPKPPKRIDSKKLPGQFCGSRAVTGETIFTLEQLSSLAEVRSRLGRHFFWELKRAGVPADLNFIRVNCTTPDHDGPIRGAWPLATAEAYEDWVGGLMEGEWHSGQFARVQVVGLTNHQLQHDEDTYRDWFRTDLNPVPYWFAPLVEEMDRVKWRSDQDGSTEPVGGREW